MGAFANEDLNLSQATANFHEDIFRPRVRHFSEPIRADYPFAKNLLADSGYGFHTGYGSGGYGDPTAANFNLNVCTSPTQDQSNCTAAYPDSGRLEWRFIKNIGWRKFSPYGAARKDWLEYRKSLRWPFFRFNPYGQNSGHFGDFYGW